MIKAPPLGRVAASVTGCQQASTAAQSIELVLW